MIPIKTETKKEKNRVPVSLKNSSSVHVRGRPATLQHHPTVQVKLKLVLYALLESPVCFGVAETPLFRVPFVVFVRFGSKVVEQRQGIRTGDGRQRTICDRVQMGTARRRVS
jgi:hypothetical protein